MDERVFARLAAVAMATPAVLASVTATRGATPRKRGSRMLVTAHDTHYSIGGGEAEARVVDAARALLVGSDARGQVDIDLSGREGAAGVCGGTMTIALTRWHGSADVARLHVIATTLQAGVALTLQPDELGAGTGSVTLKPLPRLLILGAGHCGVALHDVARLLDFEIWCYDARSPALLALRQAGARIIDGDPTVLMTALDTARDVYAVLLNRDFPTDVATLAVLARKPPRFIGMMGSRKRIAEVTAALPQHAELLRTVHAPIGLAIDAETPHEIAISIAAQLVAVRAAHLAAEDTAAVR